MAGQSGQSAKINLEQARQLAVRLAKKAGTTQLKHRREHLAVHAKTDRSLSTNVDAECQELIIKGIRERYPAHSIVAEESGRNVITSDFVWYVDPIDGTHNYMHGLDMFAAQIALAHKGETVMAVIYLPVFDEMYTAIRGKGAFLNRKRLSVSRISDLRRSMVSIRVGLRDSRIDRLEVIRKLQGKILSGRDMGCGAYELMLVAKGNIEALMEGCMDPWDFAPGSLIVEEAGGRATTTAGGPLKAAVACADVVVSNGKIHDQLIDALK